MMHDSSFILHLASCILYRVPSCISLIFIRVHLWLIKIETHSDVKRFY